MIELLLYADRPLVNSANDDSVRITEVADCFTFGKKFRIHAEAEVGAGCLAGRLFQNWPHDVIGRAGNNGALHDNDVIVRNVSQRRADFRGNLFDITKVDSLAVEGRG